MTTRTTSGKELTEDAINRLRMSDAMHRARHAIYGTASAFVIAAENPADMGETSRTRLKDLVVSVLEYVHLKLASDAANRG